MDGSQQDETRDVPEELLDLFRFTLLSHAFGISEGKVTADFQNGLEDLRQRGVLSLEDMAQARGLTRFLGRAVTVTDAEDLFTLDPVLPSSHGS
ncbi:hypothetical protein CLM62_14585 [Streptomyces sp. SA15]|uniref:hypothetical protein n=1 Tax=Streptomyces sp. SA15 TaxID=934019 RepID=UPI000BAEC92A|nr:hypothetical protein [Streptomyces sp. SA15]PAZ15265.1 hypothetical protein CLM62_14585 [Streptomyces sp. SA15]